MATTTATITQTQRTLNFSTLKPPKPKLVCFSFAAYAKTLLDQLNSLNIPILPGLTDPEFSHIESTFNFTFPPDLRSILQEGLPVGPSFPNWRSSSPQQLRLLLNLPLFSFSKNISKNNFWSDSWGPKPKNTNDASSLIKRLLDTAPVLVPIYRNCYIPVAPSTAGNPVFYIDDRDVRILSFDLAGFFQQVESLQAGAFQPLVRNAAIHMPAWAATSARRIEFWTDAAERGRRMVERGVTRGWWSGDDDDGMGLGGHLEEVFWRLRDGGWREEEVREMMMMDGCDCDDQGKSSGSQLVTDVEWHVRVLSLVLLRAGWSREDVVYSLDLQDENGGDLLEGEGKSSYLTTFNIQTAVPRRMMIIKGAAASSS